MGGGGGGAFKEQKQRQKAQTWEKCDSKQTGERTLICRMRAEIRRPSAARRDRCRGAQPLRAPGLGWCERLSVCAEYCPGSQVHFYQEANPQLQNPQRLSMDSLCLQTQGKSLGKYTPQNHLRKEGLSDSHLFAYLLSF